MARQEKPEDLVDKIKQNFKKDKEYWHDIYAAALEDAKFLSDDKFAQWNEADYNERVSSRRPALTIDQLGQFVHQVVNDIRMNTPTINVIPTGPESDEDTAEVFRGLIKNIEYASNADNAYDTSAYDAVRMSIGFIRVDHQFSNDDGFDQDIVIRRVVNPLACWLDCMSTEIDGRDARHATIIDRMTVAEFNEKFPGKEVACFEEEKKSAYKDDDEVSIAEHFYIDETRKTVGINDLGEIFDYEEGMPAKRTRTVTARKVRRVKLSGVEILEKTEFPGRYIPIVPVYGEEMWVDGKRTLLSLIRKSKDAQRMFNYWKSLETELLMKAPQAPVMAAEGQIEDYAQDWLNPSKAMVLRYKTTDAEGNPVPPPQRLEPPTIPTGIVNASRATVDDIKATMGIYNASLGIKSNETSGVAINQRKLEGDIATYHFSDNIMKSICQVGRICVCAAPEVYDTARIISVIGLEGEPKKVGINGEMAEEQEKPVDLKKGKYEVKVVPGPSYTTMRQEAVVALNEIFQKVPDLMNVMGDLYFKNADFAGASEMAERMKKIIDPRVKDDEDGTQAPDPEKMQLQAAMQQAQDIIMQMKAENDSMKQQLSNKQDDLMLKAQSEVSKAQTEKDKIELEAMKVKLQEMESASDAELKWAEIEIKRKEMAVKEAELALRAREIELNVISSQSQQVQESPVAQESSVSDALGVAMQGIVQAINNTAAPKTVIRNQDGLIEQII